MEKGEKKKGILFMLYMELAAWLASLSRCVVVRPRKPHQKKKKR